MEKRGKQGTRALTRNNMKNIVSSKRSQMQIPFSMIFSIILIVVFVAIAVFAIMKFLDVKKCAQVGMFKEDLQEAVDRAWTGDETSEIFKSSLPSGIKKVCFIDLSESGRGVNSEIFNEAQLYVGEKQNIILIPLGKACSGLDSFEIKHIDVDEIVKNENPYCLDNSGKVEMKIKKGIYDALVCVGKCDSSEGSGDKSGGDSSGDVGEVNNKCTIDDDCVKATCCHPTECVSRNNKPDCSGIVCTAVCEPGTLDCGGSCKCTNNKCEAVFNQNLKILK